MTLYSKKPTSLPSGWVKNFCTVDQNASVLNGYSYTDSGMTPANCVSACAQHGFTLGTSSLLGRIEKALTCSAAGVESGNKCYCGNTVNVAYPTKDADCKTLCSGDNYQYCGGGGYLMVYIKVTTQSIWVHSSEIILQRYLTHLLGLTHGL